MIISSQLELLSETIEVVSDSLIILSLASISPPDIDLRCFDNYHLTCSLADKSIVLRKNICRRLRTSQQYDLIYGGSSSIKDAFIKLNDEKEKKNLTFEGPARVIAVVNSFPGEDIPLEYWVMRICIAYK